MNRSWRWALIGLGGVLALTAGVVIGMRLTDSPSNADAETAVVTTASTSSTVSVTSSTTTTVTTTTSTSTVSATEFELVIPAVRDATIDSAEPDAALGGEDDLDLEEGETRTQSALIGFEVDGIPPGRVVDSVVLRMNETDSSRWGGLLSIAAGSWTEEEVTWSTAPSVGEAVAPLPADVEGLIEVDITGTVQEDGRYDFMLTTGSDDDIEYASTESGQGPELVITIAAASETGQSPSRGSVLAGAGDIASCESEGDEITAGLLDEVAAQSQEIVVFTVGDNAYEDGSAANFANCFEPSWGRHKDITRPAAGTREYRSEGALPYYEYFGAAAGSPGEGYYSYDFAAWHVIVLNSNCAEVGGCDFGSEQMAWLQADLEENQAVCTLAYWHHPLYSSTERGGNPEMASAFEVLLDAGVDVVINGDNHFYERFQPMDDDGELDELGIRQFVVGTGGHSLADFGPPVANSVVRYREAYGILAISLFPDGYRWEFTTPDGVLFADRGADNCH